MRYMFIMSSQFVEELCDTCLKFEKKRRHIRKLEEKIQRWSEESNRTASIEMARRGIKDNAAKDRIRTPLYLNQAQYSACFRYITVAALHKAYSNYTLQKRPF